MPESAALDDFMLFEALSVSAGRLLSMSSMRLGTLIRVDSGPSGGLQCDICDAEYEIDWEAIEANHNRY